MPVTEQQLLQILPNAGRQAGVFVPVLNAAMAKYGVVTRLRIAAFIAQVGHESRQFRWLQELWGPTPQQAGYEGRGQYGKWGWLQVPWSWPDPDHWPCELCRLRRGAGPGPHQQPCTAGIATACSDVCRVVLVDAGGEHPGRPERSREYHSAPQAGSPAKPIARRCMT